MIDATTAGLREVAGQDLYRRNAFRISGLPTDVDRRTARQRQHQVNAALQVGADVELGGAAEAGSDEIRAAFDRVLGDPRRRLVDELFWLWGTPGRTCSCPSSLHRDHDAAVRAHSAALDGEASSGKPAGAELTKLWSEAAQHWKKALRSPAFWDHVRHRIRTLDDRQLDVSAVDPLRDELPVALLKPLIELTVAAVDPTRLGGIARSWPVPARVLDLQLQAAADPVFDKIDAILDDLVRDLDDPDHVTRTVDQQVIPLIRQLDALVPHAGNRRTAVVRNGVAVLFNNCASMLVEAGAVYDGRARDWLDTADKLATDSRTRETVAQNRDGLVEMRRAMDEIREGIALLVRDGRSDQAIKILKTIRKSLAGSPAVDEIDRMLTGLGVRTRGRKRQDTVRGTTLRDSRPTDNRPPRGGRPRQRFFRGRALLVGLVLAAIVLAVHHFWPFGGADKVNLFSQRIADNAAVGTCISTRDGWNHDKFAVPVVDCSNPHWGEVLAYVQVTPAPARYPGADQAEALSRFQCAEALAQQGIPADQYTAEHVVTSEKYWNTDGQSAYENYATCAVRRSDDQPIPSQVTHPDRPRVPMAVSMPLFSTDIWANAPAGICVQSKASLQKAGAVPVVQCSATHWAEVLGYPELYKPGSRWPGDNAVYAAADAACKTLATGWKLPAGYTYRVGWPARDWWHDQKQTIYAYCLAHRTDDKAFKGGLK